MTSALKQAGKAVLGRIVADYRINWIYAADDLQAIPQDDPDVATVPLTSELAAALDLSTTGKMRNSLSYRRAGLDGLAIADGGKPVCVAHFADPARYDRTSTWPIRADEMAIMDLVTEDAMRGRGLATRLLAAAARIYLSQGKRRAIAFIWWSNTPSLRAFSKAGWRRIGFSLEFSSAGHWHAIRIPFSRQG
jgi:GNAT superfamily N-acetyltransferase